MEKPALIKMRKKIEEVRHPAIDDTLLDLGILERVKFEGNKAKITLAFPSPNIPIKEELIRLVKEPLEDSKMEVSVETTTMDEKTLRNFLEREQRNWRN